VDGSLLDEFQSFLAQRRIQPNVAEWSSDGDWIRSRLKEEIVNQAFGVAKGDEVAIQRDPQVTVALGALGVR
jgi:molybdopterin converting factor small subunit